MVRRSRYYGDSQQGRQYGRGWLTFLNRIHDATLVAARRESERVGMIVHAALALSALSERGTSRRNP